MKARHLPRLLFLFGVIGLIVNCYPVERAAAAWTLFMNSPADGKNPANLPLSYDLKQVQFGESDTDPSRYYFYLLFNQPVTANQFATAGGAYAGLDLDIDNDGKVDGQIRTDATAPYVSNVSHAGIYFDLSSGTPVQTGKCDVRTWSELANKATWIGFSMLRSCVSIGSSIGIQGESASDRSTVDFAPDKMWNATISTASDSNLSISTATLATAKASSVDMPTAPALSTPVVKTPANAPDDLIALASIEGKSVVTVTCGASLGSGWSAKVSLSPSMVAQGFQSYIITNEHVVKDCENSRSVLITLPNQTIVSGTLWQSDEISDVASVAVKTQIPALNWIGQAPEQGWWNAIIGSPLGVPGILTVGVISSVNPAGALATTTAHMNPGNSGGPAFDRSGRVIGIASAKYQNSEGFGIVRGAPMLCGRVVSCPNPGAIWIPNSSNQAETMTSLGNSNTSLVVDNALIQKQAMRMSATLLLSAADAIIAETESAIGQAKQQYPALRAKLNGLLAMVPTRPRLVSDESAYLTMVSKYDEDALNFQSKTKSKIKIMVRALSTAKALAPTKVSAMGKSSGS